MDEQLRPTQPHAHEIDLLHQVEEIIRSAIAEYRTGHPIAARLEITHAQQKLDRAFHGEVV